MAVRGSPRAAASRRPSLATSNETRRKAPPLNSVITHTPCAIRLPPGPPHLRAGKAPQVQRSVSKKKAPPTFWISVSRHFYYKEWVGSAHPTIFSVSLDNFGLFMEQAHQLPGLAGGIARHQDSGLPRDRQLQGGDPHPGGRGPRLLRGQAQICELFDLQRLLFCLHDAGQRGIAGIPDRMGAAQGDEGRQ